MNLEKTFKVEISADEIAEELISQNEVYIRECISELFDEDENGKPSYYWLDSNGDQEFVDLDEISPMMLEEVELELYADIDADINENGYYSDVRLDVTAKLSLQVLIWDILANSNTPPVIDITLDSLEIDSNIGGLDFDVDDLDELAEVEAALIEACATYNMNPFTEVPNYISNPMRQI